MVGVFATLAQAGRAAGAANPLTTESDELYFVSPSIEVRMSRSAPGLEALDIDGLGLGKRGANVIRPRAASNTVFTVTVSAAAGGKKVDYRRASQPASVPPPWRIEVNQHRLLLISQWSEAAAPEPLVFAFDTRHCRATVLEIFNSDGMMRLPALLHLPGRGSMRRPRRWRAG
jgi:hypothetical protein